jgi:hypothetical protein
MMGGSAQPCQIKAQRVFPIVAPAAASIAAKT